MKQKHFLITRIKEFELAKTSKDNVIQFDFPEVKMEAERVSVSVRCYSKRNNYS